MLDRRAARRGFDRAAGSYEQASVLPRELARRMAERLDYVKLAPRAILDLGCGIGADLPVLEYRYPNASITGCDLSLAMLARVPRDRSWMRRLLGNRKNEALVCADIARLPFRPGAFPLVWSNLALDWADDLGEAFAEVLRTMDIGGLFMFSLCGPDTLKELRQAFLAADAKAHVHRFIDMHDVGDLLVSRGFADPVMDMEMITLTYDRVEDLLGDLRRAGAVNTDAERRRGLTGPESWKRMHAAYEAMRRDGRLPATFEIVYGHAWKPEPRRTADGRSVVRFARGRR